jgi:hypothetical protein
VKALITFTLTSFILLGSTSTLASIKSSHPLQKVYLKNNLSNKELGALRTKTLSMAGKAVPLLIDVMKNSKYPDKNRWMATFLLGKIMGKKSSPFIAKFLKHPNWILRMASLKTLLALRDKRFAKHFAKSLKDDSLLIRTQALNNIKALKLKNVAVDVWAMLYDKKNYHNNEKSKKQGRKRTNIIRHVIQTIGELDFNEAKMPLLKMSQKKTYDDIFVDIDSALTKLYKKSSPKGGRHIKRHFWRRLLTSEARI